MKKAFYILLIIVVCSCAIKHSYEESIPHSPITKAIFNVSDPFTEVFLNDISLDSIRCKSGIADLSPTHRVERVVTSDMDLIHALESDTSIIVCYAPDNSGCGFMIENTSEEPTSVNHIECNEFPAPLASVLTSTPFYIVVPIDYVLPDGLYTEFLFETVLPPSLEDVEKTRIGRPVTPSYVTGVLQSYDNRLNNYTPIANAKVSYFTNYMGAVVPAYTYTNASGSFRLETPSMDGTVTVSLQNSKFKVRNGLSTSVYTTTVGILSDLLTFPSTHLALNYPTNFFYDVFKAAQYYFYSSNSLLSAVTRYDSSGQSLDLYAVNGPDNENSYLGFFVSSSSPYIVIYNPYISNYSGASSKIFGTVQHELGHATNYVSVGQTNMNETDAIIKESFASFFGWFNVSVFYSSVATSASMVNSICTQGRQKWTSSSNQVAYSPFYIDLFDNYDQHFYLGSSYNNDPISSVAIPAILSLSIGPKQFHSVYYPLASYIGTYFTGAEYVTFVAPYSSLL